MILLVWSSEAHVLLVSSSEASIFIYFLSKTERLKQKVCRGDFLNTTFGTRNTDKTFKT